MIKTSDGYEVDDGDNIHEVITDGLVRVYEKVNRSAYSSLRSSHSSRSGHRSRRRSVQSSRSEASRSEAGSSELAPSERSVEEVRVLPARIEASFKKEEKSSQLLEVENPIGKKEESFLNPETSYLKFFCPQIRDAIFEIPFENGIGNYWELSRHILKHLKKDASMKALLYSRFGAPLLYNLDQMKYPLPQLDLKDEFWVVLTPTKSTIDTPPEAP